MTEQDYLERRQEVRHPKQYPLRIQGIDSGGNFFVEIVLTENISLSGFCIRLSRELAVGQRLHVFTSTGQLQKQLSASVRWISGQNSKWAVGVKLERSGKAWQTL